MKFLLKYLPRGIVVITTVILSTLVAIGGLFFSFVIGAKITQYLNNHFGTDFTFWFYICCLIVIISVIINYDEFDKIIPKRKSKNDK